PARVRRPARRAPSRWRRRRAAGRLPARAGDAPMNLRDEVTQLLQELIRIDTVNPPGNETVAAELLGRYLESNGVQCALYGRSPERANLVARIPGSRSGP